MEKEILIGSLSFIGVMVTAIIGWFSTNRQRYYRQQSEAEMSLQMAALDFSNFLVEWHDTQGELERLMERTCIDRFLILRAWNGKLTPRWTTAIYQIRKGGQEHFNYVHYELDQDYIERLRHIGLGKPMLIKTEELPSCGIKSIYTNEKVTQSVWFELEQRWVPGTKSRAITYCSFATHEPEGLSDTIVTQCRIMAGRLKGVAMTFGNGERHERSPV